MEAIRARRGLSAKIARELGMTRGGVAQWQVVPAELVPAVERISGIPRHILRPTHWDPPQNLAPPADPQITPASTVTPNGERVVAAPPGDSAREAA